jgi:putative SOS response-associated peptidase YedK
MCGRYANSTSGADLAAEFDVGATFGDDLPPSWNIAPTDPVRAVVERAKRLVEGEPADEPPQRQLRTMRWGLVPSWAKDRKIGARMINARTETITEKPAFKAAAARRRCLLPASGYFEWENTALGKIPYYLHGPDERPLAFAGLYELWRDHQLADDDPDRWLWSCTVITQAAPDSLGHIHDRSPVIVPPEMWPAWLDCSRDDPEVARRLLEDIPLQPLRPRVVSTAVNSVKNNGPALIEPVAV